jgi:hypothetical protein
LSVSSPGQTGQIDFAAKINCNSDFYVQVSSLNGGLRPASVAPSGFLQVLPYSLSFSVQTESGSLAFNCSSAALQQQSAFAPTMPVNTGGVPCLQGSTRVLSTGPAYDRDASFQLRWNRPCTSAEATCPRIVSGTHTDVVTILLGHRI